MRVRKLLLTTRTTQCAEEENGTIQGQRLEMREVARRQTVEELLQRKPGQRCYGRHLHESTTGSGDGEMDVVCKLTRIQLVYKTVHVCFRFQSQRV
mgnify:CR=1 FL=1